MFKRTLAISATAAAVSIAAILPAGAQTAGSLDTYTAGATARALDLSVFGTAFGNPLDQAGLGGTFTIADTVTRIDSTPQAVASGTAVFTPLFEPSKNVGASSTSPDKETAQSCVTLADAIPEGVPLSIPAELSTDIVCVTSTAKLVNGNPLGESVSTDLVLEIKAPSLIGETPLNDVVEGIQGGLGQLFDALITPVTSQIEEETQTELVATLQGIIDGLLEEVQEGDVLMRIIVAPSKSTSALTNAGVTASAASNGVVVELLPNLPGGALAVATVGSATSSIVRDLSTGAATRTGDRAIITVAYPNSLLGGLSVLTDTLDGVLDGAVDALTKALPCDANNQLAAVLCFDLGKTVPLDAAAAKAMGFDYGPTTLGQSTSVLTLRALSAAPGGGVILNVGQTAVAAAAAATTPLPRDGGPSPFDAPTGSGSMMPLTLALLGLGAGAATLVRRSRTI